MLELIRFSNPDSKPKPLAKDATQEYKSMLKEIE
jgi:hypothetical protein